jgi:flavin-dependent dehydrogenase
MAKQYDVVVVGAGPAGLMVSQIAAKSGFKVLLVEQKKDIARIFRSCCCNLIIEPGTHKEAVKYSSGKIRFQNNNFVVPYAGSVIPLRNSFKVSPGGQTLKIDGKSPEGFVAVSYEKEALIKGLFSIVQKNKNVEILDSVQAVKAENLKDGVQVTFRDKDKIFSVNGKVAVAADGVNSKVVESLGLNRTRRKFFARFRVCSYHMVNVDCPYPNSWITFVGRGHTRTKRGQLYMCPKPHEGVTDPPVYELTLGVPIAAMVEATSARDELEYFVRNGKFAGWFKNMEIVDVRAATLNFYTPLINPIEGNVVAVGDSAAFIETYVQGAMMYGFQAGNAIVKYLSTGTGLDEYANAWKESFEYNNPEEIKLATQGFGLHVLKDEDIDYLFSLTKGDTVRGFVNEFSDPITVRTALFSHLDQIKKERPDLGATLEKFSQVSVDDALQVDARKKP